MYLTIMLRERETAILSFRRAVVIYNPAAGKLRNGRGHALLRASEALHEIAGEVVLIATSGPRTAGTLASDAIAAGADLIVAAGGDGTISEVVDGMAHSQTPLAILPGGTANVLAHEIGMHRSVARAAQQIAHCVPARIPLGAIRNGDGEARHFLLMAGAGFDALIVYELSARLKDGFGKLSYYLAGLSKLGRQLVEMDVHMNGDTRRCTFALISKVRNYGGDFEIARDVRLHDPSFEVVLFEGRDSWRYLRYLAGVATRTLQNAPGVCFERSDHVELLPVNGGRVLVQIDGELVGGLPATIQTTPEALTLLIPYCDAHERR